MTWLNAAWRGAEVQPAAPHLHQLPRPRPCAIRAHQQVIGQLRSPLPRGALRPQCGAQQRSSAVGPACRRLVTQQPHTRVAPQSDAWRHIMGAAVGGGVLRTGRDAAGSKQRGGAAGASAHLVLHSHRPPARKVDRLQCGPKHKGDGIGRQRLRLRHQLLRQPRAGDQEGGARLGQLGGVRSTCSTQGGVGGGVGACPWAGSRVQRALSLLVGAHHCGPGRCAAAPARRGPAAAAWRQLRRWLAPPCRAASGVTALPLHVVQPTAHQQWCSAARRPSAVVQCSPPPISRHATAPAARRRACPWQESDERAAGQQGSPSKRGSRQPGRLAWTGPWGRYAGRPSIGPWGAARRL